MASYLRCLAAVVHVVTDLERMGDYAAGMARICLEIGDQPLIDIPRMADKATSMLRRSLDASVERDVAAAAAIATEDDEVDALYQQVYRELLTLMLANPRPMDHATHLLWAAHNLERVADRVRNICERVLFMPAGRMQEFSRGPLGLEKITGVAQILIVEDEENLLQTLRYNLVRAGHEVRLCTDGARALEQVRGKPPDLLLLDLMLPGLSGLEVCRAIRADTTRPAVGHLPILILTARDEEIDKVVGLEVGADDYLTKPFSMHELLARVKAMLRRVEMGGGTPNLPVRLESGDLVLDLEGRRATRADQPLQLKRREFDLLTYFLRHSGQVLTRDRLLRHVWGYDDAGDTRTVDVHVRWLRSKIEPDPTTPERLQSVRGVGYVFTG